MPSQELVPISISGEYERTMELGAKWTDLTLVFNAHGTPTDADLSAECVQPDSLVFLEGYPKNEGETIAIENVLSYLNDLRMSYGTSDERYLALKEEIRTGLKKLGNYEPTSETDFMAHHIELTSKLVEKDCCILFADYGDPQNTESEYKRIFRENVGYISATAMPEIGANDRIGRTINELEKSIRGKAIAHTLREISAMNTVLTTAAVFIEDGQTESLLKNVQGQLTTYLLYGTAHKNSLTQQFVSIGVQPKVVEISPIDEHLYLDTVLDPEYNNHARRIGHAALLSLIYRFSDADAAVELTSKTYDNLEFLNMADKEEQLKFLVTCALAARAIEKEPDEAYGQFLSILRSIMPSPQDYIR